MQALSRARTGVALVAAATVLAGCGGQGDGGATSGGGSANAGPGVVADVGGGASGTTSDSTQVVGKGSTSGKPPRGAYDDTSGTRTGKPRTQRAVLARLPGPSRSTCVSVGARSVVRSGAVGMGSFAQAIALFDQAKTPYNAAPSFFYVIPHSRTASAVTVVASRPGTGTAPVVFRSRHLESAAQWHYFPVHIQIPSRGQWRFQVSVDGDHGCFLASFR
jgi:hypothetical protein